MFKLLVIFFMVKLYARNNIFLIILFLLFVCINYVPNQNRKVLEETLASFSSDAVKTTLRRLRYFKMNPPSFGSSSKISVYLSHAIESIMNGSVG